jgi:23S rRNA (guanosine2251-2'-O)-methyltransferase
LSDVIGIQAVRAVLREAPQRARSLFVQAGRRDARVNELIALAQDAGVRHQSVDQQWFRRRADDTAHQGVLLECHELSMASERELFERLPEFGAQPLLLVLDGVTDPRNFGACLRSASGAGVDAVIVPKRNSAPLSAVALKTAQGGAEDLFIVEVTNLARMLKALAEQNIWIIGTDGEAAMSYTDVDVGGGIAVVVGSEDKGLRRLTKERCDQLVSIPMRGSVASLNVSVATAVLLFEVQRRRSATAAP